MLRILKLRKMLSLRQVVPRPNCLPAHCQCLAPFIRMQRLFPHSAQCRGNGELVVVKPYLLMEPLTIELPDWWHLDQTSYFLWTSLSWLTEWESTGFLDPGELSTVLSSSWCSAVFPNAQILHYLRYISLQKLPHPSHPVSLSLSSIYGIGGYWLSLRGGGGRKLATGRVYSPVYKKT